MAEARARTNAMVVRRVLLVGSTGRTGGRVLAQLLDRGLQVRTLVRSAHRLPAGVSGRAGLEVIEADPLSIRDEELLHHLSGCDVVISCLGHTVSLRGIFGPPYDLVARFTARLYRVLEDFGGEAPVRFILMSSVSVNHPAGREIRPGRFDRAVLWVARALLPPARDNQVAADFLHHRVDADSPFLRWVMVRPDTLLEGEITKYIVQDTFVNTFLKPGSTNMANVAHFMCELATDADTWQAWTGKLPVIVNAT